VTVIRPSRARCVTGRIPRHQRAVFTFKVCWLNVMTDVLDQALFPSDELRIWPPRTGKVFRTVMKITLAVDRPRAWQPSPQQQGPHQSMSPQRRDPSHRPG